VCLCEGADIFLKRGAATELRLVCLLRGLGGQCLPRSRSPVRGSIQLRSAPLPGDEPVSCSRPCAGARRSTVGPLREPPRLTRGPGWRHGGCAGTRSRCRARGQQHPLVTPSPASPLQRGGLSCLPGNCGFPGLLDVARDLADPWWDVGWDTWR